MIQLKHEIFPEFVKFTLDVSGKLTPTSSWGNYQHGGCSKITCWIESGEEGVKSDELSVDVPISLIAALSDDMATDLQLPKPASVVMHIRNQGLITQSNFSFSYQWQRDGRAQPIAGAKRTGCFLKIGMNIFRLPYSIYRIAEGIDRINETLPENISERLLKWHEIEAYLPKETSKSITVDGFLNSTKVYSAHAFELAFKQGVDGIDFDPVLLRPKRKEDSEYYDESINFEPLLTEIDQETFADLFKNNPECQVNYSLGTGRYLILSDHLCKSLKIVHKIKKSPIGMRLEFLKNPRAALSEEGISDTVLDKIFSDRVEGFGDRKIKVIPWIKIEGQEWLPNEDSPRGLQIDDQRIDLSKSECGSLEKKIRNAISNGEATVDHKGIKIPANSSTLASIAQLSPAKPDKKISNDVKNEEVNTTNIKKCVLYVKDNYSDVKYQVKYDPRSDVPSLDQLPSTLKTSLNPHQIDGIKWMTDNYIAGVGGVLLADDMGLGKTLQSLTFLAWVRENILKSHIPDKPILIVAPTGLLNNWQEEHDKHLHEPGLGELVCAYGANLNQIKDKSDPKMLVKPLNTQKLKEANWILTTYETLSNYQTSFASVNYSAVIFDEMQKIKTPNTRITEAAQAINSEFIIGMTGTPIETRLADLWCLIDTLQPGRLGTLKEFSAKYEKDFSHTSDLKDDLTQASVAVPPLMLRRMKSSVLKGLPKINHHYFEELMPKSQADIYKQVIEDAKKTTDEGRQLEALHRLRSVSLHPYQYQPGVNDETFISESARLRATFKILDEIHNKREKVLIFIEFRDWHQSDFLPAILKRKYNLSSAPMVISGAIKSSDRQTRVNKFQEDTGEFDVMLISPRAGGVGLTLTRANHVIHLSRWWNPAVEDQCTDRVYRIGQKKEVHVYYPLARHPVLGEKSFDFCLNQLLDRRRHLSRSLLTPPVCKDDVSNLKQSVIYDASDVPLASGRTVLSLTEIDCLEPQHFEDWVANECRQIGLIVRRTQRSWDGGADLIIENMAGDIIAIIQCKHTVHGEAPFTAVSDLLRARDGYNTKNARLIAVTNASSYNSSAILTAKENNHITLVSREALSEVGRIVENLIRSS